jgi:hypothetical protein
MSWGTKIVLGMATFMLFIIAMVVYMFIVHGKDALVEDDYYEKGLSYNQEYNATQNVLDHDAQPLITIKNSQIIVQLKDSASYALKLMRPSAQKEDVALKGNTIGNSNLILIDRKLLAKGMWTFSIQWESNKKTYFFKKDITL